MPSPLARRLRQALDELPPDRPRPNQAGLAEIAGVKGASVTGWFNGATKRLNKGLLPLAAYLNVTPEWLNDGKLPMRPRPGEMRVADGADYVGAGFEITVLEAPGSSGGGRGALQNAPKVITKGPEWFAARQVVADQLVAVIADGDANADYITHGDLVIFDTHEQTPESGRIFLIDHPDGLRIRRLRRDLEGRWVVECLSSDKRRFPDEHVDTYQVHLLKIRGRFLHREGG